jgi:hypothetical protein
LILFVQTFDRVVSIGPHLQVLAEDGAFLPDGRFVTLPPTPESLRASNA